MGGALLVSYKLAHRPEDLSDGISHFQAANALAATPSRKANLAAALLERFDLPGRGDRDASRLDHAQAVGLLEQALDAANPTEDAWISRATVLLGALLDAVDRELPGADLDRALDHGERLLAAARRAQTTGEPQNLLGSAMLTAAAQGHPRGDLARGAALLAESLTLLPAAHPDRPARLSNLGAVALDRFEETGDHGDLEQAVTLNRDAFEAVDDRDPRRAMIANNHLNALVAYFRQTGERPVIDEARTLQPILIAAFAAGDSLFPIARSNLGNAAHAAFVFYRDPADLDDAIALHGDAVNDTNDTDPSGPGRHAALAVALAVALAERYHRDGDPDDLRDALTHGEQALRASRVAAHELARYKSDLGNHRHDAYLLTGSITQLDQAARLHREGLSALPDGNPSTPGLLNNAAITLSDRYDRLGDPDDLAQAVAALERALAITGPSHPDAPARTANLATNLHRRYTLSGEPSDLDAAEQFAQQAHVGTTNPDVRLTAYSVLVNVACDRFAITDADEHRTRLEQLDRHADDLVLRPRSQPAQHFRRAHIRALLGLEHVEQLRAAAASGLTVNPAVALEAGRQLAFYGIRRQAHGSPDGHACVREGVQAGADALARLTADAHDPRHALAWLKAASGLAAVDAHSFVLREDTAAAAAAFEQGHATLLSGRLQLAGHHPTQTATIVRIWATPVGGAAIIQRDDEHDSVLLPGLDVDRARRSVHRLAIAARLGQRALIPVLARVIADVTALLVPMVERLEPGEPLIFCPAGPVAMLPIGATTTPHGRLAALHRLRFSPTATLAHWASSTAACRVMDPARSWSLAAPAPTAYPALAGARREGAHFAREPNRLLGAQATRARALEALRDGTLVHFACHARTTARDPLASHLLLADDEPVFAEELISLESPARLVVLAACDTAAIHGAFADEALGLATALHLGGVPGVIASLWPVPDHATSELMCRFGDHLADGLDPDEALQSAAATAAPISPAAAAAFVLIGA